MSTTTTVTQSSVPAEKQLQYGDSAVRFLLESLEHAVESVHGPVSAEWRSVAQWLADHNLELNDLAARFEAKRLPAKIQQTVARLGGPAAFNRHVSGRQLCEGFRDHAKAKYGLLAGVVLRSWGIRKTRDIGTMVYELIEQGRLQRQPDDSIDDFNDVYDFRATFERDYHIDTQQAPTAGSAKE